MHITHLNQKREKIEKDTPGHMCFCKLFLLLRESQYFYTILPRVWNNAFRALVIFSICVKRKKKKKKSKFTVKLKLKLKNWLPTYVPINYFLFFYAFLVPYIYIPTWCYKEFFARTREMEKLHLYHIFPYWTSCQNERNCSYYNFPLFICTWMIKLSKYISIIGHIACLENLISILKTTSRYVCHFCPNAF